ncbi:MAG: hypothetical protein PHP05_05395 [Sideroxydans sp.]|nr:hypothetical protein [Sideroxydans sp.]
MWDTKTIFLIVACSVTGCSKENTTWIEIARSEAMQVYMGKKIEMGERPELPFVGATVLWNYLQPQTSPEGKQYKSFKAKFLINCARGQAADFEFARYFEQMATGDIVDSGMRDLKEAEREHKDISDPALREVAERACGRAGKGMPH